MTSLVNRCRDQRGLTEGNSSGVIVGDMPSIRKAHCPIDKEIDRWAVWVSDVVLLLFGDGVGIWTDGAIQGGVAKYVTSEW